MESGTNIAPSLPFPECSERLTRESVAHDHGPEHRRPISLHSLLSIDGKTKAVKLKAGHTGLTLPSFLEVSATATEPDIEGALCQWGFNCAVIKCGQHDKFLCFQRDFQFDTQHVHYLFVNEDEADKEGEILHSQTDHMSHLDIMKFLDGLGYSRAVVLDVQTKHLGINYVTFCNSMPQPPVKEVREKVRTPWPPRLVHQWQEGPLFSLNECEQQCGSQRVHTGFDRHDIEELTAAGDTFLQTDFSGIDLPDYIQEKINPATKDKTYDRWLIFTDGSSMSSLRRLVPQQADDLGQPDTWAMLVLGETISRQWHLHGRDHWLVHSPSQVRHLRSQLHLRRAHRCRGSRETGIDLGRFVAAHTKQPHSNGVLLRFNDLRATSLWRHGHGFSRRILPSHEKHIPVS